MGEVGLSRVRAAEEAGPIMKGEAPIGPVARSRRKAPAKLAGLIAAYCRAHPDRSAEELILAVGFSLRLVAPYHHGVAAALAQEARSSAPDPLLHRVPTEFLHTVGSLQLLENVPPDLQEELGPATVDQYLSQARLLLVWFLATYRGRPHGVGKLTTPTWKALAAQAKAVTGKKGAEGHIGWLGLYCEGLGLGPDQLTTAVTEGWYGWMVGESGLKGHLQVYYAAGQVWAGLAAAGRVPAVAFYHRPSRRNPYILRLEQLPARLRWIYDEFARRAQSDDPRHWPTTARLGTRTLEKYEQALCALLGVLQAQGTDLEALSPADLFRTPDAVEALCAYWFEQAGGAWKAWHHQLLEMLRTMARTIVVPMASPALDLGWMDGQLQRVRPTVKTTAHRRITLTQVNRMIALVEAHAAQLKATGAPLKKRLVAERDLLAFGLLRDRMLRRGDLWKAQLVDGPPPDPGTARNQVRGYFSRTAPYRYRIFTKTKNLAEGRLPVAVRPWFEEYLAVRQQLGIDSPWLLVSERGGRLEEKGLNMRVRFWSQKAGFSMCLHDFRRVFVTEKVEANVGMDKIKVMTGNRSVAVLEAHYQVKESRDASRALNQLVEAHYRDLIEAVPLKVWEAGDRAAQQPSMRRALLATAPSLAEGGRR